MAWTKASILGIVAMVGLAFAALLPPNNALYWIGLTANAYIIGQLTFRSWDCEGTHR